mgnify:CR=1 FL=1
MSAPTSPPQPTVEDTTEVGTGTIYGTLARLYEEPSEELFAALDSGSLFADLRRLTQKTDLEVTVPSVETDDEYTLLCARFNDLFVVGYPDPVIPRYESEHVETEWEQVNLDLTRVYDYFDVEIDQEEREHHDYLVIELEFAGYLSRLAATGDPAAKRARADFIERHLLPFVEGLEASIAGEQNTGIYRDIVDFTADFVRADLGHLRQELEDPTE